jgi:hypothetical protein
MRERPRPAGGEEGNPPGRSQSAQPERTNEPALPCTAPVNSPVCAATFVRCTSAHCPIIYEREGRHLRQPQVQEPDGDRVTSALAVAATRSRVITGGARGADTIADDVTAAISATVRMMRGDQGGRDARCATPAYQRSSPSEERASAPPIVHRSLGAATRAMSVSMDDER